MNGRSGPIAPVANQRAGPRSASRHSRYVPAISPLNLNTLSKQFSNIPSLANPCTPVRFRYSPPIFSMNYDLLCSLGYHLGYQFLVLCRFCSWLFPFGCGLPCSHDLARFPCIFDDHLLGCVAAVAGDFVVSAPGPGKFHHSPVTQCMLIKSH